MKRFLEVSVPTAIGIVLLVLCTVNGSFFWAYYALGMGLVWWYRKSFNAESTILAMFIFGWAWIVLWVGMLAFMWVSPHRSKSIAQMISDPIKVHDI